jgi:hypothetical protein
LPAAQSTQALAILNQMMGTWAQQLTSSAIAGVSVPLLAGRSTYSWASTGDITTVPAPSNQNQIQSATLRLGTTTPPIEIPLAVLTDDMYTAIPIKSLSSTQPTAIWFQIGAPGNAPTVFVWPVPNNALHSLGIYVQLNFGPFADLSTTSYVFPDGYEEAIIYNLERRLAGPYGRDMPAEDAILARETFANIMRANQRLSDLPNDFATAFGPAHKHGYNIQSGNY